MKRISGSKVLMCLLYIALYSVQKIKELNKKSKRIFICVINVPVRLVSVTGEEEGIYR